MEDEIEVEKERLSELESAYEGEEDEGKAQKLEFMIDRKDGKIKGLTARMEAMMEEEEEEEDGEEEDCCPNCGSDLVEIGRDRITKNRVFQCEKCHGLYEEE